MHIHQFAEHIELKLGMRGVTDTHRLRPRVTRQPRHFPFGQPPLAADAIHDLQLIRTAGHGAQQPLAPSLSLLNVAGMHGAEQHERGVAQPAEAIIPIALATEPFGQ